MLYLFNCVREYVRVCVCARKRGGERVKEKGGGEREREGGGSFGSKILMAVLNYCFCDLFFSQLFSAFSCRYQIITFNAMCVCEREIDRERERESIHTYIYSYILYTHFHGAVKQWRARWHRC